MSTELTEVSKAVAEFDRVGVGLASLREKYDNVVYDVGTTQGMTDAKAARVAIREPRYEIERIRKAAKAPILALGKKLDTEAALITSELEKLELPIDSAIKAEEDRKEQERQAKILAEQRRVDALMTRINELRNAVTDAAGCTSAKIQQYIDDLSKVNVDASFEEFQQEAADVKEGSLSRLSRMHLAAIGQEEEQARIKAEREELARLRVEQQKREKEDADRRAAEEKVAKAARDAETAKQAEELRKQREAQDAENARVRAEQAAEQKKIDDQRAELARQQEELRKAQEPPPAPPPPPVSKRGKAVPVPKASELVGVLAAHYRARPDTIIDWLRAVDWNKAEAA